MPDPLPPPDGRPSDGPAPASGPDPAPPPSAPQPGDDDGERLFDDVAGPGSGDGVWHAGSGEAAGAGSSTVNPRDGQRSATGSFFRELPVLLVVAFLLAFLLRTFVLQVFYIPSSSMEPTLRIDDRMVVEKITYRFREPVRGEVVVFEGDELVDTSADRGVGDRFVRGVGQFLGVVPASARDFVKRVIGLPGDEILIEGGQVFVNGAPIDEPYVVFDDFSDFGPVTVPDDALFFLGDNRPNSSDSRRAQLGFVPRDHVVGRSMLIIWPVDHAGLLTGVEHEVPATPGTATGDTTGGDVRADDPAAAD